jgi:chromosomal replication initiator protein
VGPSNKLAYAAADSVAEHPASNYNPLFIYGDSGLGKTHLLYAIAHVIRRREKGSKIAYVKGDDLTNELVAAIREGPAKTAEMREKYRQADLLLVDDVQFIAGKKQTQEEFFHTFNTLYESGKQIVLTSDRPPSEMTQLEDRLRTRFEWGLLVDVAPPDF